MFLEQNINSQNNFGKYLLGSLVVFFASFFGQIPMIIALMIKIISNKKDLQTALSNPYKILDSNLFLFLMLLSFVFALLILFLVIRKFHNQTILSVTTSREKFDWRRFWFSFSVWAVFTIVSTVISYYSSPEMFVINFKPVQFAILFVIAVLLIPVQTSLEEYLFRGYLMQGFAGLFRNRFAPLVLTSVIFGSLHIMNPEIDKLGYVILVYYIGTGFLLGILTLMDEGMELSLGFHAANNLIGCLLITTDWTVLQTNSVLKDISEPKAGLEIFVPVLVIYPILIFAFSKKYGWTNWKEKLFGEI